MRRIYLGYSKERISESVSRKSDCKPIEKSESSIRISDKPNAALSWTHYLKPIRIENIEERNFYEIESLNSNWSIRELKRQINSSLYERLALSRDKKEVMVHKADDPKRLLGV